MFIWYFILFSKQNLYYYVYSMLFNFLTRLVFVHLSNISQLRTLNIRQGYFNLNMEKFQTYTTS